MKKSISISFRSLFIAPIGIICLLVVFSVGTAQPPLFSKHQVQNGFKYSNSSLVRTNQTSGLTKPVMKKKVKSIVGGLSQRRSSASSVDVSRDLLDYFSTLNKASSQSAKVAPRISEALISSDQRQALAALKQTTKNKSVVAYFDKKNGTPAFLQGNFGSIPPLVRAKTANSAETIAKRFLNDNKSLLKLVDPNTEMRSIKVQTDKLGFQHVRFQQEYRGIPVFGKQSIVHINKTGAPYLLNGRYIPTINNVNNLGLTPSLSLEQAQDKVRQHLTFDSLKFNANELMIYADNSDPVLTYKLDVDKSLSERWIYFIDAHNGAIVHRINGIKTATVAADGADEFGSNQSFTAWQGTDGLYYMIDPTTSLDDVTASYDPITNGINNTGDTVIYDLRNGNEESPLFHVTSNNLNSGWDPTAVSAMKNIQVVYQYYKNTFQRKSIDDDDSNLIAVIHYGNNQDQVFWNKTLIVFGDGDQVFDSPVKCLDAVAHEITHGVTESSAGLVYQYQPGALDESFSDVFGVMIDRENWLIGEDCTIMAPGHLRNLQNPADGLTPQPTKMSEYKNLPLNIDDGGVHVNSGIPNRAAFLTADVIGRDKTQAIYYRALTQYLTASSQFIDARRALIQSTSDLYGADSEEVGAVKVAWDTVEVVEGDGPDNTTPTPIDPVVGDDRMYYLYKDLEGTLTVYEQLMGANGEYIPSQDRQLTTVAALQTRPAPYTSAAGTIVAFVDTANNIRFVNSLGGEVSEPIGDNEISSISMSPDGRYFAYTSIFIDDDAIHVLDLVNDVSTDYKIPLPNFQEGISGDFGKVRFADSLSFDYASQKLVFDMLVCLPEPGDPCSSSNIQSGYNIWSIGVLDLSLDNGRFVFPFPPQNPDINLAYPIYASNNNFVIALDVQDGSSITTYTFNLETQAATPIIQTNRASVPSFWGDDDFITIEFPNENNESFAARIPIDTNTWESSGDATVINPFSVNNPIMHRAGQRTISTVLDISTNNMDFGSVDVGNEKSLNVVISNNGNHDVDITAIDVIGEAQVFKRLKGTNTRLPSGSKLTVVVNFAPSSADDTFTGLLEIASNGQPSILSVSLTGTSQQPRTENPAESNDSESANNPAGSESSSSNGGGGGGSPSPFILLFILLIALYRQVNRSYGIK